VKSFDLPVVFTTYKVKSAKSLPDCVGKCDVEKRVITVANAANLEIARAVIWHEALHALMHELGRPELCGDEALIEGLALSIMRIRVEVPSL
jgi:hypothetical protein